LGLIPKKRKPRTEAKRGERILLMHSFRMIESTEMKTRMIKLDHSAEEHEQLWLEIRMGSTSDEHEAQVYLSLYSV